MLEIKGFDEIDRKLAELQRRAEALCGERNVPYNELALMIGVHVRTLHAAARSGRLVSTPSTSSPF